MHRMRHNVTTTRPRRPLRLLLGLALAAVPLLGGRASASLLKKDAPPAYPDITADLPSSKINYTYDPATGLGNFQMTNTPFVLTGGPDPGEDYSILPNADTGVRTQVINAVLDGSGKLVDSPNNLYELHGTVTAKGKTYSGLLLKGVPDAFGSQDLGSLRENTDWFDVSIKVTGGELAGAFGPDLYMFLATENGSSFTGSFTQGFTGEKIVTNTRGYHAPLPFPEVPEPTTLTILLVGGAGLAYRTRRRGK